MRLPNRKPGKYTFATFDPNITEEKFEALKNKLDRLKNYSRPQAAKLVMEHAANGDFSENAEYQISKGRLRGINKTIEELEYQINHAQIIQSPKNIDTVQIGHTVTILANGKEQTFQILGPSETKPLAGIISYKSPLGAALLGKKVNDVAELIIAGKKTNFKIINIK
ncbi:MAG: GreA/GreB family elongation factor [Patescibacteria group bacterium]|jgi:transcription elongation factor GreA